MPTSRNCPDDAVTLVPESVDGDAMLKLSRDAVGLLDGAYPPDAPAKVRGSLASAFVSKGFAMNGSQVNWPKLEAAVAPILAGVAKVFPDVSRTGRDEGGWLRRTINMGRATHTDTILLATFVLSRLPEVEKPFGEGPWPCRNPLAEHHSENVVTHLTTKRYGDGSTRGWFDCDCGYGYSLFRGADGTVRKPTFKHYGPLLATFVRDRSKEGWSIKRTAKAAGIDPATLTRLVREGAMPNSWDPDLVARSAPRLSFRSRRKP